MLIERILAEALPKETGAARLQQVGLLALIFMLQGEDEPITVSRLAGLTGQSVGEISRHLKKLMRVEVVERTQILNKQGRGYAWAISIKHNAKTKRLVEAMEKAGKKQ